MKKIKRILSSLLVAVMILSAVPLGQLAGLDLGINAKAASNEETVYNYFKNVMNVNTAVACGVLANIKAESGFNPKSSYTEKGGFVSYGICQWNRGRLDNLKSFCSKKGLDYKTLNAQLSFLKSELEGSKKSVWSSIKAQGNNEAGAYQAGYIWAQKFEVCAHYINGVDQYVKRGNMAKTYWKKYGANNSDSSIEYAMFPFNEIYISRTNRLLDPDQKNAMRDGGHYKYAFDLIGSDNNVKAPFTGKLKYIQKGGSHYVIFQSKNKVRIANGKIDYVTLMLCHDNDVSNLKVGQEIKQGEVFYQQGTYGNVTGKHLHIEAAIGKYTTLMQVRNNGSQLNDVLFLAQNTKRTKDYIKVSKANGGYKIYLTWRIAGVSKPVAPKIYFNSPVSDISVNDQISFSWAKVANATSYDVYVNGKKVKNIAGTSYALKATEAKKYEVKVYAKNSVGTSSASNSLSVTAHNPCKVTFVNWDDTPLTAEPVTVEYGKNAVVPEIPTHEGYTFIGWDKSLTSIKSDCTIKAQYKINTYTVKFFDSKGNVIKTEKVTYNQSATAPTDVNAPTGYSFLGWSTDKYLTVKSDLNIYGIYDWGNRQLPIAMSNVSATRQQDGYYVYFDLTNYPDAITRGRAVVSLKTAEGKLIDTTESAAFSIPKSGTKTQMEVFVPSDEVASKAEVIIVNSYSAGVPISEMKSSEISFSENMWSNWSDTAPAEGTYSKVEERTLYRSADKELATANTSTKDGWTLYDTTSAWGPYGSWSSWSKTKATGTSSRQVETKQVTDAAAYTQYNLYYYRYYNTDYKSYYYTYAAVSGGKKYTRTVKSTEVKYYKTYSGHEGYVRTSGYFDNKREIWFIASKNDISAKTHTEYRYRDRSLAYTYHFYRWKDWTDWSENAITASDSKKVETKKQYRYIGNGVVNENNSGVARTVSGNVGSAYAGKQLSLFIYKVDEASDFTNEFVGQQTVGENGSYSFTFKLREEPSVKTGDFTVAIGLEGSNNTMIVDTIKAPKPTFEVKFIVDGKQVGETQTVEKGSAAVLPANPTKEGYTFCGWSADTTNVQSNLEVEANFVINRYTVVFVDWVAETVSIKEFEHGEILTYSDAAEIKGYTFSGWEELEGIDAVVTQNMVLTAKYDRDIFEVVFYDFDGKEIARKNVEYGDAAELPTEPTEEAMIFCGWETNEDLYFVTNNIEAYANFIYEETCEIPYADVRTNEFTEAQTVTLSCDTPNAVIYYTTDGSDPSERGDAGSTAKKYTEPLVISKSCVLRFYAEAADMNSSDINSETYVISTGSSESSLMPFENLPEYVTANPSKYDVRIETGYKYKDLTSTDKLGESYKLANEGWTMYDTSYSEWSSWSMAEPDANGLIVETESRKGDPIDKPFYQYKHWKYYDSEAQKYVCSINEVEGHEGEWETVELETSLPVNSFIGENPAYLYNGELWFSRSVVIKSVEADYMIYRYRVVTQSYYKWTDWTDKAPAAGDTRETVSDSVYRYTVPATHLVTVHTNNQNENEYYIVFENEPVIIDENAVECEGYTISGYYSDSEYKNVWDVENSLVTSKLDLYPKYETIMYTVKFKLSDGTVLSEQQVEYGSEASAPDVSVDDGYVFIGWDKDFSSVTENTEVTAVIKNIDELSKINLKKSSFTTMVGSGVNVVESITLADESSTIVWTSSDENIATVDDKGFVTAKSVGTVTVKAVASDGGSAECKVTVLPDESDIVNVKDISLGSKAEYIGINSTVQLTATVTPENATNKTVTWSTSDNTIATVDNTGKVTGHKAGSVVVISESADGKCRDYCIIRVVGITPSLNSTTVIDAENGFIYGLDVGLNSIDSFVELSSSSCSLEYDENKNGFGTGTVINMVNDSTVIDSYTIVIFGDVNGDGWYDGQDAVVVNMLANGMLTREQVGEAVWTAADCNHDGIIDQLDVDLLNHASIVLSNVDQTKTKEELLETSAYNEYIGLIDQNYEAVEDKPEDNDPATGNISFIKALLTFIWNFIKRFFLIVK